MMPTRSMTRWIWRMVAWSGAGLGSANPWATMAMRRAWAWVSRVILLGTPALYGRVRTALDFHTCRRCSTTAIGQTVLLTDTGAQIALMPTDEGPQSSHTVLAFEVE